MAICGFCKRGVVRWENHAPRCTDWIKAGKPQMAEQDGFWVPVTEDTEPALAEASIPVTEHHSRIAAVENGALVTENTILAAAPAEVSGPFSVEDVTELKEILTWFRKQKADSVCSEMGCHKPRYAKGLCRNHYEQARYRSRQSGTN